METPDERITCQNWIAGMGTKSRRHGRERRRFLSCSRAYYRIQTHAALPCGCTRNARLSCPTELSWTETWPRLLTPITNLFLNCKGANIDEPYAGESHRRDRSRRRD